MKFESLGEIQNHPWVGVYAYDAPAIKAAEKFALDVANTTSARAEALRCIIRDAMGCTEDQLLAKPDEQLLIAHRVSLAAQKSAEI